MPLDHLILDYSSGQIAPPLDPVDDDQSVHNDVTVNRIGGTSARAEQTTGPLSTAAPPNGVGRYDTAVDLSLFGDDQVGDAASWLLHLGTVDEARFPSITVNLSASPALVPTVLSMDCGDLISMLNLPVWVANGPVRQIMLGYTETFGPDGSWTVTFNATPYSLYRVLVADDTTYGRLDSEGSTLASGATSTATSISVATATDHALWITTAGYPTEFPFDIQVAGEVMTVTAVTGATSPQTFTVTRSVNGVVKAQSAGAQVRLAYPLYVI